MTWDVEEHKKANKELDRQWQLKSLRLLQKSLLSSGDKRICMICENFDEEKYLDDGIMLCKKSGHSIRIMRERFHSEFQSDFYANIDECGKDGNWFERKENHEMD